MPPLPLTSEQRRAVETTGSSLIVSAGAGSGKTAVLARRCAYLVCDAPPSWRCDIDELLVLTFTEAAAAEMRSRIAEAIRARLANRPHDDRLGKQAALVEVAQISTVHSFCLWLVRRWFSELGIDPGATVLDEDEATLLKSEVLDAFFSQLYAVRSAPDDPLGVLERHPTGNVRAAKRQEGREQDGAPVAEEPLQQESAWAFIKLVDDYGLGHDRFVAQLVLKLFAFTASLPDPTAWLQEAVDSVAHRPQEVVLETLASLRAELCMQIGYCERLIAILQEGNISGDFYADRIREYTEQLRAWSAVLEELPDSVKRQASPAAGGNAPGQDIERALALFERVRCQIVEFQFSRARGPRLPKDSDPAVVQARDSASAQLSDVKKRLFGERLKKRFGLFSVEQWLDGLRRIAPYVTTIADLVTGFREAYTLRKRRLDVLDFSDLERLAFELLHNREEPDQPTEAARMLRRRFAHVLVDEFQDINPIQQAIIRLASREPDPDRADNLFVVGDVKQSIYRFRLAEPAIFARRLADAHNVSSRHVAIALQSNFRSRPPILEAVNLIFSQLMRPDAGVVVYDDEAHLRPARELDANEPHQPVELHLVERGWMASELDEETLERSVADLHDPARWTPIEREAFVIGSRIRAWMEDGEPSPTGKPLRYRDVTVLLRAARINAEKIAAMLTAMGIDAFADVGGSLFGALEVRDVLAALQVLDNVQQDIPLTSVLRSGIFGEPLTEDDLIAIRCLDRAIPFHEAVRRYVEDGQSSGLCDRLGRVMECINRYRRQVRRRPLADVLWSLYQSQGYLAYVGGLPNGTQRRANLLKLHELARRFGSFRRQGLHRFLNFIQSLADTEQTVASAPAIGESEDVVRIMSIHQGKGLEFPVVFVAGLGTRFNLGDRSGSMIFERKAKIGLRVIDTERMIEYPSATHRLAADEIEAATREEELRILYVAMTRARDKLVLVGSQHGIDECRDMAHGSTVRPPSRLEIATASTPLDWLLAAISSAPPGTLSGPSGTAAAQPPFEMHLHEVEAMTAWRIPGHVDHTDCSTRKAVARGRQLPPQEPLAPDDEHVEQVLSRIDYTYPSLASASVRAVMAASEFKGAYDFTRNTEQRQGRWEDSETFQIPPSKYTTLQPDTAAHRGIVTHRALQHLNFASALDAVGVASELQRMEADGLLTAEDRSLVDEPALAWFVSTPLAVAIRKAGQAYRREFQYIATESPGYFDPSVGSLPGDEVLVRGIVDGILPVGEAIEIVDFKTDRVRPEDVPRRAEAYGPQMEIYARAMSRIFKKPVWTCWLVFLSARQVLATRDVGDE